MFRPLLRLAAVIAAAHLIAVLGAAVLIRDPVQQSLYGAQIVYTREAPEERRMVFVHAALRPEAPFRPIMGELQSLVRLMIVNSLDCADDGRSILFTGNGQILQTDRFGNGLAVLGEGGFGLGSAWFSPDSSTILFTALAERSRLSHLYLLDVGTGEAEMLTRWETVESTFYADWSPDGARVVFSDFVAPDGTLNILDVRTRAQQIILRGRPDERITQVSWSPDGRWIAFAMGNEDGSDLFRVRPDGTGMEQLTGLNDVSPALHSAPVWSPDSSLLLYAEGGGLNLMAVPGGHSWRVTRNTYGPACWLSENPP